MAFQSLYRRYRPQRFSELRGQDHVVRALGNAVRAGTVAHAYLFSGPRGTGKTSTARILAKAMNCRAPVDGEPCCECEPCLAVEAGTSLDVHELDAASNRGVDDMRDLIGRVALGTAGRTKLYILDEVHMLTKDASNTLLKTLEEPPAHVVFVLATTEPEKVLPTIRSRTQHFEFHLLPAAVLEEHLGWVVSDAGLDLDDAAIELAVRRGAGSARDALSALDQIAAAGVAADDGSVLDEFGEALCERDTGRALKAVAQATAAGRDPKLLAEALLAHLREAFLSLMAPELVSLPDRAAERIADQARRLGPATVVRALDGLGESLVAMREAPDPRVCLEVALIRLTKPDSDVSPGALLERIERLERAARAGVTSAPPEKPVAAGEEPERDRPAAASRAALGAVRKTAAERPPAREPEPVDVPEPPATDPAVTEPAVTEPAATEPSAPAADLPSRDELTLAWGDRVLPSLRGKVKALYAAGRFTAVDDDTAVFAVASEPTRKKAEELLGTVEEAFAQHFGRRIPIRLVVAGESSPPEDAPEEDIGSVAHLEDAPADSGSGIERVAAAFPGAEVVEE